MSSAETTIDVPQTGSINSHARKRKENLDRHHYHSKFGKAALVSLGLAIWPGAGAVVGMGLLDHWYNNDQVRYQTEIKAKEAAISSDSQRLNSFSFYVGSRCMNATMIYGQNSQLETVPVSSAAWQLEATGSCTSTSGGNLQAFVADVRTTEQSIADDKRNISTIKLEKNKEPSLPFELAAGAMAGVAIETVTPLAVLAIAMKIADF